MANRYWKEYECMTLKTAGYFGLSEVVNDVDLDAVLRCIDSNSYQYTRDLSVIQTDPKVVSAAIDALHKRS